jgi:hypothetical protein
MTIITTSPPLPNSSHKLNTADLYLYGYRYYSLELRKWLRRGLMGRNMGPIV